MEYPSSIFLDFHLHIKQDKCPRIPLMSIANRIIKLPGFLLLEVKPNNSALRRNWQRVVSFSPTSLF